MPRGPFYKVAHAPLPPAPVFNEIEEVGHLIGMLRPSRCAQPDPIAEEAFEILEQINQSGFLPLSEVRRVSFQAMADLRRPSNATTLNLMQVLLDLHISGDLKTVPARKIIFARLAGYKKSYERMPCYGGAMRGRGLH